MRSIVEYDLCVYCLYLNCVLDEIQVCSTAIILGPQMRIPISTVGHSRRRQLPRPYSIQLPHQHIPNLNLTLPRLHIPLLQPQTIQIPHDPIRTRLN